MNPVPLHYVWDYRDVDRNFWRKHLEDWLPRRVFDAHTHVVSPRFLLETLSEEKRRQYWVSEVSEPIDAETAQRCDGVVYPGRQVSRIAMAYPSLEFDFDASNEYTRTESLKRGWHSLAMLRPQWTAEQVDAILAKPGVIGLKPYYALISRNPHTRDEHLEASIFDFLPHHALEVANERRAWITLHVPKAGRLGHPDNIREVKEIRRRYPNIILVIAHLGRSYTEPHAKEGLLPLADDQGLYFDNSAVLNPAVHRLALEVIGPQRILYGTDNPIFYMRGRRTWQDRSYINHTSHDFYFNRGRHEPPEVEAGYTLYMYEAMRAIKQACQELGISKAQVEAIFHGNAERLIESVLQSKAMKERNNARS